MSEQKFNKTFQQIMICGRLAKDPVISYTPKGKAVANFGLVVNDDNGSSDYIPCVAWESKAKNIADNLTKGALILCEGKMKSSKYKDSENREQFKLQFELSGTGKLIFLDSKKPDIDGLAELPDIPQLGEQS